MKIRINHMTSTIVLCFSNNKGIALSSKLKDYKNIGKILTFNFDSQPEFWIEI